MKVDKSVINLINRRNVLDMVRLNGPVSKSELSQMTSLSLPTVMKIIEEFKASGVVLESGKGVSTGGKPPSIVEFNYRSGNILGVDINEYRIDVILMDLAANVICERTQDVDRCTSCQRIIDQLKLLVRSIIDEAVVEERSILGIGIGIYGIVDAATGTVVSSPMFNWHDIDLLQPLEEAFHFPVIIDNGTRAMALGEKMVGHAKEAENFLYVNFGYDIDAALLINGGLYYGASSQAGSLGEAPILLDGQFRTLNELATARGIEEQAIRKVCSLSRGEDSLILDMVFGHSDRINIYTIIEAANNGDKIAAQLLEDGAKYAAMAVKSTITMFDPELIILEGKLPRRGEIFLHSFKQTLQELTADRRGCPVRVFFSDLGKHVGAIGAASFILSRYIEVGGFLSASKGISQQKIRT